MTEIVLDKVNHDAELAQKIGQAFLILCMIIGLYCSVSLLKWAVNVRITEADVVATNMVTAEVRERQLGCLAKNIYHEAGSEPFEGKVAVAQVTLNRSTSGKFPEDVCGVIYQKSIVYEKVLCQFSWVCDRVSNFRPINQAMYDESMSVAKRVLLEGFRLPGLKEAMYFHADNINPHWPKQQIAHIGGHIFYK
jgi:N-acetylmuramoyl-L-alanine amidase